MRQVIRCTLPTRFSAPGLPELNHSQVSYALCSMCYAPMLLRTCYECPVLTWYGIR